MARTQGATTKKLIWRAHVMINDHVLHDEQYPSIAAAARALDLPYNVLSEITKGRTKMTHPKYKFHPKISMTRLSGASEIDE